MRIDPARTLPVLSQRRLAVSLAAALGCSLTPVWAQQAGPSDPSVMMDRLPYVHEQARSATQASDRTPAHPTATTHFVDTCADDGSPNSLRSLIELSPNVHSGDTIDLTQLPMMCSKITLSNTFADAPITMTQDTLYLHGPGADQLAIDANGYSSVFRHYGYGTLQIEGLTITNGYHKTAGPPQVLPRGGCIFSTGSVVLMSSVVSHCEAVSTGYSYEARGGAIYAQGAIRLYFSSILHNSATSTVSWAYGGGVSAKAGLMISYTTISDNSAIAPVFSSSGGVYATAVTTIVGSTLSQNRAGQGAGAYFLGPAAVADITNSTISGNVATESAGGVYTAAPLRVFNSTIAFNRCGTCNFGAGLELRTPNAVLTIHSSIIANNLSRLYGGGDVFVFDGAQIDAMSSSNLIGAPENLVLPADTIIDCPKLDPLANNGGLTFTHVLNHASPAIDQGDNGAHLDSDQRQVTRVIGASADIGAVERAPTDHDERVFLGGFDARCEW